MQTLYSVSRPTSLGLAFRTLHLIDTCLFAVMQPHLYYSTTHCTRAADTFVELLKGEEIAPIDKLLTKHVLLGCALSLLLLTLQLEIKLLLALHRFQMNAIPIGVSTGDSKAKCAR